MRFMHLTAAFFLIPIAGLAAESAPDLSGIWMLQGRAAERELHLTDEGRRIQAAYDLLEDDPSLQCVPASISRVWANPNVRIGIEQSATNILISYEFFDLRRDLPLGNASVMATTPSTRSNKAKAAPRAIRRYLRRCSFCRTIARANASSVAVKPPA